MFHNVLSKQTTVTLLMDEHVSRLKIVPSCNLYTYLLKLKVVKRSRRVWNASFALISILFEMSSANVPEESPKCKVHPTIVHLGVSRSLTLTTL